MGRKHSSNRMEDFLEKEINELEEEVSKLDTQVNDLITMCYTLVLTAKETVKTGDTWELKNVLNKAWVKRLEKMVEGGL